MQKEKEPIQEEPGRTPGSAEGEDEPVAGELTDEPGRTPGSAEGEDTDEESGKNGRAK